MKWEYKAFAVGVALLAGVFYIGNQVDEYQAQQAKSERLAKIAALPKPVPAEPKPPALALSDRFKAERPAMMAAMQKALQTKDYYSTLSYGEDFKSVSDREFDELWGRVVLAEGQATAIALKQQEAKDKAEARKKGVAIGMTREQVIGSNWGRPQSVNTTTSAYGKREQWVYGGRNYLYFENGVLTTIQN
jgi:hypothetical protein